MPIIGGIGTLFGPVLGAAILTVLSESLNAALAAFGVDVPGVKLVLYGVVLGIAIMFMPHGVWPDPGAAPRLRAAAPRRRPCRRARRRLPARRSPGCGRCLS